MSRKALQIALIILGFVPIVSGILGMMGIFDPVYASLGLPSDPLLDSNLRFLSGVWFVVGIVVLATVRQIEKYFQLYLVVWSMIFVGGIGRLISIFVVGLPPIPFIGFTILEVVGAPFFIYWHYSVSIEIKEG